MHLNLPTALLYDVTTRVALCIDSFVIMDYIDISCSIRRLSFLMYLQFNLLRFYYRRQVVILDFFLHLSGDFDRG